MSATTSSIVALCSVTFLQAYLLVSVFPYAAYIPVHFLHISEEDAGPFAALFATSFMIGRTVTAHLWGLFADIYGRRFVIILSLIGSGVASLWFGLTDSYNQALIARFMTGAWSSIVGVSKTVATELALAHGDDQNNTQMIETRIVGRAMSMRAYGFLVAPAVAGLLADPMKVRENGEVDVAEIKVEGNNLLYVSFCKLLQKYPYLLPNLLGAVLCLISATAVHCYIPETNENSRSAKLIGKDFFQWGQKSISKLQCYKTNDQSNGLNNSPDEYGSILNDNESDNRSSWVQIWTRRKTRAHLIAYWLYSVAVINIDEAFPLYCISRNTLGGLQEHEIGKILSVSGVLFAVGQFKTYTFIVDRFGDYASLVLGCWLGVFPVALYPLASLFYRTENNRWSMLYLALLSGITKIFQSAFFSSITVTTNRTVPAELRGRMNAIGSIGAGLSKAFGPLFVGLWMAFCLSIDNDDDFPIGSAVAWVGIAVVSALSMSAILKRL